MKRHPMHYTLAAAHGRHRQQGSLLVLVVVCLVLMALLGTAYLQVARVDRLATADTYQSNIDQVASATINYIGKVLRDDLVDQNGAFFSIEQTTIANNYAQGTGDESYDYPWTRGSYNNWSVRLDDGTIAAADGGILDDTWLAATTPSFTGTDATWPHISNLMGSFLRIPAVGSATTAPEELPTNVNDATNRWRNDTLIPISHTGGHTPLTDDNSTNSIPLGVDTDMDGILDAKWQWAPLRQIGSVKYVMAVRIIDNSSLLNLSTGTALSSDGSSVTGARGYFPSEIDLSRIVARMPIAGPATWQQELATNTVAPDESLFTRRGLSTTLPTPMGTLTIDGSGQANWSAGITTQAGAWFNQIQLWNLPSNRIALANEMELRRLGGVNNVRVTTSLEEAMPSLLRRLSTETLYNNITSYDASVTTDDQRRLAFFQGSNPSAPNDPAQSVDSREFPSLRNQFTTQSAAALFAGNPVNIGRLNYDSASPVSFAQAQRRLKYDLVNQDGGNTTNNATRLTGLYKRVHEILRIRNGSSTANAYLGLDTTADATLLSDIAFEYALAIQDYSDPDRLPSAVTPATSFVPGRTYYSLENLPFFREVYMQAAYQNRDLRDGVGNPGTDGIPDTWQYTADSAALAFEIANPFDRTIDFDDGGPAIRVKVGPNTYTLTGTIDSRATRVFYANTLAANRRAEGPEATTRGDLLVDLGLTAGPGVDALPEGVTDIVGSRIVFELQVEVAAGMWVTYDRLGGDPPPAPLQIQFDASNYHNDISALAADIDLYHFQQVSVARPGSRGGTPGPFYLMNTNKAVELIGPTINKPAFTTNYDRFESDDKGIAATIEGDTNLDPNFQLPNANRQFMSVAELGWIPMFGFYSNGSNLADEEVGDFPARMTTLAANRRFLDLSGNVVPTSIGMTHAALLFEQFSTISPRHDGVDNDDDGQIDNDTEQFVRGQININTAPLHILTLGAPLNDTIAQTESLMRTIVHYRDNPGDRNAMTGPPPGSATGVRQAGGIASIGELTHLINSGFSAGAIDMANAVERIDGYTSVAPTTFATSSIDLFPIPEQVSPPTVVANPSPQDGPEQQLARFQFLSQVFNTRSDTFTAFVRLRGYPANDFSNGEIESRNFLVVYDRSNILTASDMPRIIGVYVYNVP